MLQDIMKNLYKLVFKRPMITGFMLSFIILLVEIQQGIFVGRIFSYQEQDVILSDDIDIIRRPKRNDQFYTKIKDDETSSTRSKNFNIRTGIDEDLKVEGIKKTSNIDSIREVATTKTVDNIKSSVSESFPRSSNIFNFYTHPNNFVKTLSSCFLNKDCHVVYHHIGKTGGTNVESRFFNVFPFHARKTKMSSCCSGKVMEKFLKFSRFYCAAKFTAYQVRASQFETVISECMKYYSTLYEEKNVSSKKSIVILVSIREPASRTLSNIHQLCNKNLNRRSETLKQACASCDYEAHPEEFDKIVQTTNKDYLGIMRTIQQASKYGGRVKSLSFDTDDIDRMFGMLQESLNESSNHTFPLNEKTNPEKHSKCNFGMKSRMLKDLAVSREIYRNITSGQVY